MKFIRKNTKLFEEVSENFPKLNYVIHKINGYGAEAISLLVQMDVGLLQ